MRARPSVACVYIEHVIVPTTVPQRNGVLARQSLTPAQPHAGVVRLHASAASRWRGAASRQRDPRQRGALPPAPRQRRPTPARGTARAGDTCHQRGRSPRQRDVSRWRGGMSRWRGECKLQMVTLRGSRVTAASPLIQGRVAPTADTVSISNQLYVLRTTGTTYYDSIYHRRTV